MQVHNVHERVLDAPAEAVGRLLDDIGGPHDALWPAPEWSPMWLDGPPAVGTAGGHGSLRYRVTTYEPLRKIVFTLDAGQDLSGWHGFEVVARGPDRAVLRHVVAGRAHGGCGCSGRAWSGRCTTASSSRSSTGPSSPSAPAPSDRPGSP